MQNQAVLESIYAATFAEHYLDIVENLPDDVQRLLTQFRELDNDQYRIFMSEIDDLLQAYEREHDNGAAQKSILAKIHRQLIIAQNIGDEKLALVQNVLNILDDNGQILIEDAHNLDYPPIVALSHSGSSHRRSNIKSKSPPRVKSSNDESGLQTTSSDLDDDGHTKKNSDKRRPSSKLPPKSDSINTKSQHGISKKSSNRPSGPTKSATQKPSNWKSTGTKSDKKVKRRKRQSLETSAKRLSGNTSGGQPAKIEELSTKPGLNKEADHEDTTTKTTSTEPTGRQVPVSNRKATPSNKQNIDLSSMDIDPDEPTYCLCDQVSYGDMIGCDNDLCPIEWFHFNCVQLTTKPKGKWFCPKCRAGDKANVMRPKAQFLRELERYNKEREEKVVQQNMHGSRNKR